MARDAGRKNQGRLCKAQILQILHAWTSCITNGSHSFVVRLADTKCGYAFATVNWKLGTGTLQQRICRHGKGAEIGVTSDP
jgi:hypothetical protein